MKLFLFYFQARKHILFIFMEGKVCFENKKDMTIYLKIKNEEKEGFTCL